MRDNLQCCTPPFSQLAEPLKASKLSKSIGNRRQLWYYLLSNFPPHESSKLNITEREPQTKVSKLEGGPILCFELLIILKIVIIYVFEICKTLSWFPKSKNYIRMYLKKKKCRLRRMSQRKAISGLDGMGWKSPSGVNNLYNIWQNCKHDNIYNSLSKKKIYMFYILKKKISHRSIAKVANLANQDDRSSKCCVHLPISHLNTATNHPSRTVTED